MRAGFLVNEVRAGLQRNLTMTLAMIITTAIALGLFGGGLLVVRLADQSRHIYLDRVESQVFITDEISIHDPECIQKVCQGLRHLIEQRNDVQSLRFLTRQQAYNDAIHRFPEFKDLVTPEDSPFPASFIVKLTSPELSEDFDHALRHQPGVAGILNQKKLVDRLFSILDGLRDAAFGIALFQAIGAILLIANMVQVTAYTRRTEISIMRLVGASRWYTQLPFLLEAVIASLIGISLAISGLLIVQECFLNKVLEQFYQAHLITRIDYLDILYISPLLLIVGVVMAALTAYVTLRIYVRR